LGQKDENGHVVQQRAMRIRRALIPLVAVFLTSLAAAPTSAHQTPQQRRDYERLSGEWQLTRAVVNGKQLPESQARHTVLITDGDTFRFPQASGVATHSAGRFVVYPLRNPKQVDSYAIGGKNAGQLTRGIYEIIDATHKRACWAPPGKARPTSFESPAGSDFICQYWSKIGPIPKSR